MTRPESARRAKGIARLAGLGFLLCASPVFAQGGPGSYAASFLKIPVGARLMSSPDAVAGMRPDASLMFSNPAFMAGMDHPELFASSSNWLDNLSFNSIGFVTPVGTRGTVLGVGTTLLYSGGLQGYDDALNVVSEESFYSVGLDFNVGHRFGRTGLSAAAGATYLREHVLPEDGSGFAFHLGASYWLGRNMFHAAARDLGGSVSFADGSWEIAPEWLAGGGRVFDSPVGQFFAGAQVATSDAYGTRVQLGVDYQLNSLFTLRTGLHDNLDDSQSEAPFNAGFGMRYGAFAVEYAYTPQEYFSSTHTFSLAYAFGTPHGPRTGATVPLGDPAPPVADSEPAAPAPRGSKALPPASGVVFVLVAGSHSWLESARAEVRALELLKIPSRVESEGPRFRVVIGRYATFDEAESTRLKYAQHGHTFQIIAR
jgi:hypothetical protein